MLGKSYVTIYEGIKPPKNLVFDMKWDVTRDLAKTEESSLIRCDGQKGQFLSVYLLLT